MLTNYSILFSPISIYPSPRKPKRIHFSRLTNGSWRVIARTILVVLIVDESQGLPVHVLEEIRLLSNMETPNEKLLQIVLVGQPELEIKLKRPDLRQLQQRIALRCRTRH